MYIIIKKMSKSELFLYCMICNSINLYNLNKLQPILYNIPKSTKDTKQKAKTHKIVKIHHNKKRKNSI